MPSKDCKVIFCGRFRSFLDKRVTKVNTYLQFVNLDLPYLYSRFFVPSSTWILDFRHLSLGDISLSTGGSRSGPDWVTLVKNEVAIILDDKDDVLLRRGFRGPDVFAAVGAAHNLVSQKKLYKVNHRIREIIGCRDGVNLLDDQVSICLHFDSLHVGALLLGVLPLWVAVLVHNNFAVLLHSEFVHAILTPQAVALEQPFIVTKGVVTVRHIE